MIVIRPPDRAEFEAARRILKAAGLDPTTPLRFENTLVAVDESKVVGIGQVKYHSDCREIGSLVVLPEYQHRGIATRIIEELEARAGFPVYLTCYQTMMPFYLRFGYKIVPFNEAPGSFRWKLALTQLLRRVGRRVYLMRKTSA